MNNTSNGYVGRTRTYRPNRTQMDLAVRKASALFTDATKLQDSDPAEAETLAIMSFAQSNLAIATMMLAQFVDED